jgi:pimeloyl-ACP methyl ester carboxylesterase
MPAQMPIPPGPYPDNGWVNGAAPNGRIIGWDLSTTNEDDLLRSGKGALLPVGGGPDDYHLERQALILVHGIQGVLADLQTLVDRFWNWPYQIYVLAYDDYNRRTSLNGLDLAEELRSLAPRLGAEPRVTLIGHSLGGIVIREALDELAVDTAGLSLFQRVRFYGLDNPWSGYDGPADGPLFDLVRVFMPDGLEDMRARSGMFQGDPSSPDPALRAGLLRVPLPEVVSVSLVFAESGSEVSDYTEGLVADLPTKMATYYNDGTAVDGDPQLVNFYDALRSAAVYPALDAELRAAAARGALDGNAVLDTLLRYYPKFPGDHMGILAEHPGQRSLLDYLASELTTF